MAATLNRTERAEDRPARDDDREPHAPPAPKDRRVQASPPPTFRTTSSSRFRRSLERLHDAS